MQKWYFAIAGVALVVAYKYFMTKKAMDAVKGRKKAVL